MSITGFFNTRAGKVLDRYLVPCLVAALLVTGVVMVAAQLWPHEHVRLNGETVWADGVEPVVTQGEIGNLTFLVPDACNAGGYDITFERTIVSGPRGDFGVLAVWDIDDFRIENNIKVCDSPIPVQVLFPVLYPPGQYQVEIVAVYKPNMFHEERVSFKSPPFEITEAVG